MTSKPCESKISFCLLLAIENTLANNEVFLSKMQKAQVSNLIEKGSRVNSDFLPHIPVWMFQSISNLNFFQLINRPIPVRTEFK